MISTVAAIKFGLIKCYNREGLQLTQQSTTADDTTSNDINTWQHLYAHCQYTLRAAEKFLLDLKIARERILTVIQVMCVIYNVL